MKKARKAPHVPLADLKLAHLYADPLDPEENRLVNLKVPADLLNRVHRVARELGATKTEAIIALLNEGLAAARPDSSRRSSPSN